MRKQNPIALIMFVIACELVGLASLPFTSSSVWTWYVTLQKPLFTPPNWLFGPVWVTLYALMGAAIYLVYQRRGRVERVRHAAGWFAFQLTLNFFWSILFFGLRNPLLGLIDIIALWIAIAMTIKEFYPISKNAAWLMLPYLLWVTLATYLNLSIVLLNR